MIFLVFLTLVITAGFSWYFFLYSKQEELKNDDSQYEIMEMLFGEQKKWILAPGVNAITFYDGDIDSLIIKSKLLSIIKANPWLVSRIIKRNSIIYMKFPKAIFSCSKFVLDDYFVELTIDNNKLATKDEEEFSEHSSVESLFRYIEKHFVKIAKQCLNQENEVLFKVIIIKIIEKGNVTPTKTAFIISLSHILGDGHTFILFILCLITIHL
jgi:hypothetical protein